MQKKGKFYITTTIPYVNARPHAGHALEYAQADALARYYRLAGKDVFFLTGTDENSLKNYQAAKEGGISTKNLVDRNAEIFKDLAEKLNISFDDFIRTTEARHIETAKKIWLAAKDKIYKKKYRGLYCVGCEMFYKESELVDGLCPDHKIKPEIVEEENYFFKLSDYQCQLEKIIESDEMEIVPAVRKNEALSFIKLGLEDFSISRLAERGDGWGIEVPGDPGQRMYVWFDALTNYLSAEKYWPADVHCLGKGVLRFHAVYWPVMLLAAGLALPKKLFVHGYLTVGGQKMSKSLGNVVDPFDLIERYGADAVRYYLLREVSPFEDADITEEKFKEAYNANLANGLGNLVSRVMKMSEQYLDNPVDISSTKPMDDVNKPLENFEFNRAMFSMWSYMKDIDGMIQEEKPFELVKRDKKSAQKRVMYYVKELARIAKHLRPFMPDTSEKILEAIKANKMPESLFPRKE
ncbi:methionine--tRNA ligase [Patescibacteria group bacterium]|nr:methionine--tRNA ligase [Patescibacteria group bacterium]